MQKIDTGKYKMNYRVPLYQVSVEIKNLALNPYTESTNKHLQSLWRRSCDPGFDWCSLLEQYDTSD